MGKRLHNLQWHIIFVIVWVILLEELSIASFISGLVISVFSLKFTEKFLIGGSFSELYPINILWILRYSFYLLIEIYSAGFNTAKLTLTGKINPGIVDIKTNLSNDYYITILANSITLTPGTVTIDTDGNKLKVLWLDVKTNDPIKAGKLIKENLEKRIR